MSRSLSTLGISIVLLAALPASAASPDIDKRLDGLDGLSKIELMRCEAAYALAVHTSPGNDADNCPKEAIKSIKQDLEEAKAKHAPHARWSSQSVAEHLIAVAQGAIILAKARQDPAVVSESLTHFREYLRCLFKK